MVNLLIDVTQGVHAGECDLNGPNMANFLGESNSNTRHTETASGFAHLSGDFDFETRTFSLQGCRIERNT